MVEKPELTEIEEFKKLATWAKSIGAAHVKNAHLEMTFFNDPSVFIPKEASVTGPISEEERAAQEDARRKAKLFRSV